LTLLKNSRFGRPALLALLLLLSFVAVPFAGLQTSALAVCPDTARDFYYSDATYTVKVGECYHACCQLWTCTGQVTMFGKNVMKRSCSVE
jgi:hypothetical protein